MKTRIKVIEKNDGSKVYIPQARGLGRYETLHIVVGLLIPIYGWGLLIVEHFFWDHLSVWSDDSLNTENEAKKGIDKFLHEINRRRARKIANKVKKVSYLKYP